MKTRIIATLLAVVMVLSMIPVMASATESETVPSLTSTNLVLNSILSLNITADLGNDSVNDYAVHILIGEDAKAQIITNPVAKDGKYVYTAQLLAHRMHETVTINLVKGEEVKATQSWKLSEYAKKIQEKYPDNTKLLALIEALSNYGTYADLYADKVAIQTPIPAVAAVTADTLKPYKLVLKQDKELSALASLYLDEACDLRFKFSTTAMDGLTLYVNGEECDVEPSGTEQVIYTIPQILPQNWDKAYEVVVKDGETAVFTLSYSVMSYGYQCLKLAQEREIGLNGLLASMYLYSVAANDYITSGGLGDLDDPAVLPGVDNEIDVGELWGGI